jgi:H+/Cl- antiporter ClcA
MSNPETQALFDSDRTIDLPLEPSIDANVDLSYDRLIFWSAIIGIVGGIVSLICYYSLTASIFFVWHTLPDLLALTLPVRVQIWQYTWIVTTVGGFLVGLSLHFLGIPGEIAMVIRDIHDPGRIDYRNNFSMIVSSFISIVVGGSAGPEAPLVQVSGSFGSWVAAKLNLSPEFVRKLTICGVSAVFGAFFGTPLGGAIFPLELLHRRGLEYYEAIVPAVISAILGFMVFQAGQGVPVGYHFPAAPETSLTVVGEAIILALIGAAIGILFIWSFQAIGKLAKLIKHQTILLATLGGFLIGSIAIFFPQTLFFSQTEIADLLETGTTIGITGLLLIAVAKILAIGFTLHSGFRGGFILPLFFIGAVIGTAISLAIPQVNITVAMLCVMAAINVAVTKTPIGTTIILSVISDTSMLPVILIASFVGFIATSWISLVPTQRSRSLPLAAITGIPQSELSPNP